MIVAEKYIFTGEEMVRKDLWEVKENEKVCGIDIDEVLGEYTKSWIEFVNKECGTIYDDIFVMKDTIPYQQYRDLKEKYRLSGIKEKMPVKEGASELTLELRKMGYVIIILSKRPVQKYPTLFKQTVNWLDNNNIVYDGIIFDENKHTKIITEIPHLRFMIEDHRYIANVIGKLGYKVYLMDTKYNKGNLHHNVTRVNNLREVIEYVKRDETL